MIARNIPSEEASVNEELTGRVTQAILELDRATAGDEGVDYKPLYYYLFNGISGVLEALGEEDAGTAAALKKLQCNAEELYLRQAEALGEILPS